MLASLIANWFLHPLAGKGYQFWSGIGSDISELTLAAAVIVAILTWWRTHNCHQRRCPRIQWHPHPDHGHPVCRHHHPDGDGLPAAAR